MKKYTKEKQLYKTLEKLTNLRPVIQTAKNTAEVVIYEKLLALIEGIRYVN